LKVFINYISLPTIFYEHTISGGGGRGWKVKLSARKCKFLAITPCRSSLRATTAASAEHKIFKFVGLKLESNKCFQLTVQFNNEINPQTIKNDKNHDKNHDDEHKESHEISHILQ